MKNKLIPDTVALDDAQSALVIIDQTRLPTEVVMLHLHETDEIVEAIRALRVRGAPAIGVAAAIGLYLAAKRLNTEDMNQFIDQLRAEKDKLAASRPTAVNLFWALERMMAVAERNVTGTVAETKQRLLTEAEAIRDEDIRVCRQIGENGLTLLHDGDCVLTHCNAGRLAATRYGTALAPLYVGLEQGMRFRVYADETRPLLQGARLTCFELTEAGIPTTLICDNMAAQVLRDGRVQAIFVGADRIAANGDACNKIGTSGLAVLAHYYHVPFYVLAPRSTIDPACADGHAIPIEERAPEEVTVIGARQMAPDAVSVYNPAFDVTEHSLISGIVTEYGVLRAPFGPAIAALFQNETV